MRILSITPEVPYPPQKGTALRNFNFIRHLAARHELTLLTFDAGNCTTQNATGLADLCKRVELVPKPVRRRVSRLCDLPTKHPDLSRRLRSQAMTERLRHVLSNDHFDLVQIEGLEMAHHWDAIAREGDPRRLPPVVLDEHNAEYVLQRRAFQIDASSPRKWLGAAYSLIQWQKLVRYERRFCASMAGVVTASEADQQAVLALDPKIRAAVVPNGVDVEYYRGARRSANSLQLVFVGTLDFRPNVDGVTWLAKCIWPDIKRAVPEAEMHVVGRNSKPGLRTLLEGAGIFLHCDVPDVRPYLANAALAIVPLRVGGGSRLKVLEAMAAGVPVAGTSVGLEGIRITRETALIADEPRAMVTAVTELLRDRGRREAMASQAAALVEREYDWKVIVPRLEKFHEDIVSS